MQSYKQYTKVIYSRCFGNVSSSLACINIEGIADVLQVVGGIFRSC